jgi:PTS system mannose-specific IIB component/fructoselysine and glucoselysine-specific PTS system IIB component
VTLVLHRIDDRLIHGQVVLGWGPPLGVEFIVLVDDAVATSDWERELYEMAVPPDMEVYFHPVEGSAAALAQYRADERPGILLTGSVESMRRLVEGNGIPAVNVGGIHHRADRTPRLRYVFLSPAEEQALREIAARGVEVTAQDVPSAHPVPLETLLTSRHEL